MTGCQNMGGSIGLGLPLATGAAVACPDRKVVALQADGSAMYTVQALWTQAREGLDVTTVLFSNRTYQILRGELANVGAGNPGPQGARHARPRPPRHRLGRAGEEPRRAGRAGRPTWTGSTAASPRGSPRRGRIWSRWCCKTRKNTSTAEGAEDARRTRRIQYVIPARPDPLRRERLTGPSPRQMDFCARIASSR